jgi:hypothetical protein
MEISQPDASPGNQRSWRLPREGPGPEEGGALGAEARGGAENEGAGAPPPEPREGSGAEKAGGPLGADLDGAEKDGAGDDGRGAL